MNIFQSFQCQCVFPHIMLTQLYPHHLWGYYGWVAPVCSKNCSLFQKLVVSTHPENMSQFGSLPQSSGWKFQKSFKPPPPPGMYKTLYSKWWDKPPFSWLAGFLNHQQYDEYRLIHVDSSISASAKKGWSKSSLASSLSSGSRLTAGWLARDQPRSTKNPAWFSIENTGCLKTGPLKWFSWWNNPYITG